jgi:predicted transcriptional regulator
MRGAELPAKSEAVPRTIAKEDCAQEARLSEVAATMERVHCVVVESSYIKAKALTARKAMTAPAITIAPYESAAMAARIMCERHVNRLPVVRDGLLVGIVTVPTSFAPSRAPTRRSSGN